MAIAHDIEYERPASLEDALAALASAGSGARVLAGGTDLVPWLREDLIEPGLLVDIKAIPGLAGIEVIDGRLEMGALVTFSDLLDSDGVADSVPVLIEMAHQMASVGIRNRATVAGNICSAVPSADAAPPLLVYDTEVHVAREGSLRLVPLANWFVGPRATTLVPGEVVTSLTLHLPDVEHAAVFVKLARYSGEDLAQASLCVLVTAEREYRVAFGAVAPRPFRSGAIEDRLRGRPLDARLVGEAVAMVAEEISPISDIRASAEYRTHMCRIMLERALWAACARLAGEVPDYRTHLI